MSNNNFYIPIDQPLASNPVTDLDKLSKITLCECLTVDQLITMGKDPINIYDDEESKEYKRINNEIDLIYEKGGFREGQLHASLSAHKFYYAGDAIVRFFTDDSINKIIIGDSSGGLRNHTIFKCRKRKMVFEVHYGHNNCDIFPLHGIMFYLEAYSPVLPKREEWINLSNNLPNYDMVPLPSID